VVSEYISGGSYDLTGKTVELVMTPNGKVGGIVCDVDKADSGRIFGTIIQEVPGTTSGGELVDAIKIVNAADDEATYFIDDDSTLDGKEASDLGHAIIADAKVAPGKLVSFTLQSNGNIDNIKTTDIVTGASAAGVDDDLDTLKIGSTWYAGKDVVVFAYDTATTDASVKKWSDLEDNALTLTNTISYYVDGNDLMYVMLTDEGLTGDSNYAVYVTRGKNADDYFITAIVDGQAAQYTLAGSADYTKALTLAKGNVIEFTWDGSDIKIVGKAAPTSVTAPLEVSKLKLSNNIIEFSDGSTNTAYLVDKDTVVFDCSDTDNLAKLTLNDIALGDQVFVVLDKTAATPANEPVLAIVITDSIEFAKQVK
jgi:uncharacterized protein YkvS